MIKISMFKKSMSEKSEFKNYMHKTNLWIIALLLAALVQGCGETTETETAQATDVKATSEELTTLEQRISYAIGADIAESLKRDGIAIDVDMFTAGLNDGLGDKELRMTAEERTQAKREISQQLQEKAQQEQEALAQANEQEGQEFLAANVQKEGVMVTDSGLQYKVISEGKGPKPQATDTVTVHYRGTLVDGTQFDSSYDRGTPTSFPLNGVIQGWTEGLQLMNEGSKFEFYIPYQLAYGANGRQPSIPPKATLVFEVELLKAQQHETEATE